MLFSKEGSSGGFSGCKVQLVYNVKNLALKIKLIVDNQNI